jgi:predicted HAD superfamily Cof-like phosphohydrolase
MTAATNAEPRDALEREIIRLRAEVTSARAENKRLQEDLDYHRRQSRANREFTSRLLEENTQMFDNLTHVQRRCTELKELTRDASIIDEQVREFHDVMGIENRASLGVPDTETIRLRCRLVIEEAFELIAASLHGDASDDVESHLDVALELIENWPTAPDIIEVADALADLDYVVAGSRLAYGITRKPVADEVHRSNMAKAPNGVVIRDAKKKVLKPPGWTPPDIRKALGLEAPRDGIVLHGWTCTACGVFNGEEKESHETCRACGVVR